MKNILMFLNVHYKNALKLVNDFNITKQKTWTAQTYLNELYVQIGHVFNVLYNKTEVEESKRKIDNLGDELSDVVLQLINLADYLNINMYDITNIKDYNVSDLKGFNVLLGQLTETIMENNECRFKKNRDGFSNSYDFIKDRIFKLFIIVFNIAEENKLDMIEEFDKMLKDANGFLSGFAKKDNKAIEFIDIYDKNENYLGYCEKNEAHKQGYWHKTVGCLIYNKRRKKVYFQLKNPNHNKVHSKELLEITTGGHLTLGENLKNIVREVKEETGLEVDYDDMNFIYKKICNKNVSKDYIVREFQYYYGLDKKVKLKDFKNYDKSEVTSFVELNIKEVIKLLKGKRKKINGRIIKDNKSKSIKLTIKDFDPDFIKDGLFITLLSKINVNMQKNSINRDYRKLYRKTKKMKKETPEKFYFDNGKTIGTKDFSKKNINYSVIEYNTKRGKNDYIVFILAIKNHKPVTHIKIKRFKNRYLSEKYFKDLCLYVENNTNEDIIKNALKSIK